MCVLVVVAMPIVPLGWSRTNLGGREGREKGRREKEKEKEKERIGVGDRRREKAKS